MRRFTLRLVGLSATLAVAALAGCTAVAGFEPLQFDGATTLSAEASIDEAAPLAADGPHEGAADANAPPADAGAADVVTSPHDAAVVPDGACSSPAGPSMVRVADYCIDATEVTNAHYQQFLSAGAAPVLPAACSWKTAFRPDDAAPLYAEPRPNRPVVGVDWCDATAYCAWAGKRLCGDQWVFACSKGNVNLYPYGGAWQEGRCNDRAPPGQRSDDVASNAQCVGGYPGLFDMSGNVAEWVDSCTGDDCSARGGSFSTLELGDSCNDVSRFRRGARSPAVGFRCCSR